jgi:hypothetical protein
LSIPADDTAREEIRRNFLTVSDTVIRQTKLFRH